MVQGSKCSYNTCQAKAHEHAGMGVIGGLGLVVHHPGTGQPTLPWSKPDACIANKGCSVLSGETIKSSSCINMFELSIHTAAACHAASTAPCSD